MRIRKSTSLIIACMCIILLSACDNSKKEAEAIIKNFITAVNSDEMVKANELYPNYSGWKFNLRKVNIKSLTIKRIEYEKRPEDNGTVIDCYVSTVYDGDKIIKWKLRKKDNETSFKILKSYGFYELDKQVFKDKMGCDVRTNSKVNNDDFSPFFDDVISDHSMAKSTMKAINAVELVRKYIKTLSEDKELSYTLYPKSKSFYSCVECNPSSFNIRRVSYDGTIEKKTFIVSSDSISFYVKDDLIINSKGYYIYTEKLNYLIAMGGKLSCSPDNCDVEVMQSLFRDCDKIEQEKAEKQQKEQTKQQFKKLGIGIVSFGLNGSGSNKGIKIEVFNVTDKIIKYVIISVVGFDPVGGKVWDNGYVSKCRIIGPLEPGESGDISFEELWKNKFHIVDSVGLTQITVMYKDGSSKTINKPKSCMLPDNWRSIFE